MQLMLGCSIKAEEIYKAHKPLLWKKSDAANI